MPLSVSQRQARHKETILRYLTEQNRHILDLNDKIEKLANIVAALANELKSSPPSPPLGSSLDSLPNPPLIPPSEKNIHSRVYDPRFARWYEGYPEKVGKGAAERSFLKALKSGATEEALTEGLRRYVTYKPHDRPWCNPATWLNQERWNDEYPAPKPNGHSPSFGRIRDPTEIMAEITARDRAKELGR